MSAKRILVTGSRDWTDWGTVDTALSRYLVFEAVTVVHGDCKDGLDAMAKAWVVVQQNLGSHHVFEESHPAKWNVHGLRAGYVRNQEMVNLGAEICLAFAMPCQKPVGRGPGKCPQAVPHDSHGTTHCAKKAKSHGIPVQFYRGYGDEAMPPLW